MLITEMKSVSNRPTEALLKLVGGSLETEFSTESGRRYSLSIRITEKGDRTYLLEGNIHENNSFKYDLLEESLIVEN